VASVVKISFSAAAMPDIKLGARTWACLRLNNQLYSLMKKETQKTFRFFLKEGDNYEIKCRKKEHRAFSQPGFDGARRR
jgi:hypothetical protein